ncbi:hypothetical protein, partial [Salmonella enterica]|uniref:hypothetical protein n=1 Tax=Salmonella enterica TaxID=28901 RepID=UPI0006465B56
LQTVNRALEAAGVPVFGTRQDAIDRAEDRARFQPAGDRLTVKPPAHPTGPALAPAVEKEQAVGHPVVVRASYVVGGRGTVTG